MIKFDHVTKKYGEVKVIDDISFEIKEGQFVILIGPSGCGKTTTLKMINRLIEPTEGQIRINDEDTSTVDKVALRRKIGYVIQQIGLFPNMTIAENISVVPKLLKYTKERQDTIVRDLLEMVGMPYDQYANKYPTQLSGGQQQRIGVLRALAASPPIILMDEPFGALDPMTRNTLQIEIKKIQQKLNKTIVFVTHDMEEALNLADTIVFMDQGKIIQMASPEELLKNPASELIKQFLGKHINNGQEELVIAKDVMRTNVYTVTDNRGPNHCLSMMRNHNIDSLLVVDNNDSYLGTLSVEDIRLHGKDKETIKELIKTKHVLVHEDDEAKECFDKLLKSKENYLIVLNSDNKIAGIITRTSMARALAERLWG
ncbi:MAG: ABC transporter ATP-binding protein [Erysipelotrichaceae bacterium]|nr:ABC transporter ATP-binding protein [Erysipelotrichaceae bacterium]